jgi:predicted Zn-dependent protease with MMP-like domain
MDLEKIADELYALPADEFVAKRDEQAALARKAKNKDLAAEIKALGKPTQTAWIVNQLVRRRPKLLKQVLQLGVALREAQQSLAGAELKKLTVQRRALLQQLAHESRELAEELGHPIGTSTEQEVASTLGAALADEQLAGQLASGRLTRALEFSTFGELQATPEVRAPAEKDNQLQIARWRKELKKAQEAFSTAESEREALEERAQRLREQLQNVEEQLAEAVQAAEEANAEVGRLQKELEDALA